MENEYQRQGMVVFQAFPSIMRLGQARLQQLCDEWTATDLARACGITAIEVGDEDAGFPIRPRSSGAVPDVTDGRLHKILLGLFTHIVEHGFTAEQEAIGRRIIEVVARPIVPPSAGPEASRAGLSRPGLGGMARRAQLRFDSPATTPRQ